MYHFNLWNLPYDLVISIIGGLVSSYISIFYVAKYSTNKERKKHINENLIKCLDEIIKNKTEDLTEDAINKQITWIKDLATKKRIEKDYNLWPGFAKKELPFSPLAYYQYLLLDNTHNFLITIQSDLPKGYPKKLEKVNAILSIYQQFTRFNNTTRNYESTLRDEINKLMNLGVLDENKYNFVVTDYCAEIWKFYKEIMKTIDPLYNTIDPDNKSDLLLETTIFNPDLY